MVTMILTHLLQPVICSCWILQKLLEDKGAHLLKLAFKGAKKIKTLLVGKNLKFLLKEFQSVSH